MVKTIQYSPQSILPHISAPPSTAFGSLRSFRGRGQLSFVPSAPVLSRFPEVTLSLSLSDGVGPPAVTRAHALSLIAELPISNS